MLSDLFYWPATWDLGPFLGWLRCAFTHPSSAKHPVMHQVEVDDWESYRGGMRWRGTKKITVWRCCDYTCDVCGREWENVPDR
jgi:hypothetical protein